jgi:hypothetical protein
MKTGPCLADRLLAHGAPLVAPLRSVSGLLVFADVLDALAKAENDGGPEGQDYVDLMEAVGHVADTRAKACRERLMRRTLA